MRKADFLDGTICVPEAGQKYYGYTEKYLRAAARGVIPTLEFGPLAKVSVEVMEAMAALARCRKAGPY
jgi:hypothetical protein